MCSSPDPMSGGAVRSIQMLQSGCPLYETPRATSFSGGLALVVDGIWELIAAMRANS